METGSKLVSTITLRETLLRLPSMVASALFFITAYQLVQILGDQSYSLIKRGALLLLALFGLYFLFSTLTKKLSQINNVLLLNIFLILLLSEGILRVMHESLPLSLVKLLPQDARGSILAEKGVFTARNMQGSGMVYSHQRNMTFKNLPWLKIDANGYRNEEIFSELDLVVLGDSVTFAQDSPRDLTNLLREHGYKTRNLAFGGYGTLQQRDAYLRYIIEPGVKHRYVLVNFCFCNDVSDNLYYLQVKAKGGGWKDYLSGGDVPAFAFPFSIEPPWSVAILFSAPYLMLGKIYSYVPQDFSRNFTLPRGVIESGNWFPKRLPALYGDEEWAPVLNALREISLEAKKVDAKLIIGYYPDVAQLYLLNFKEDDPIAAYAQQTLEDATLRLKKISNELDGFFIDYTPTLQKGNQNIGVTVTDAEPNIHPSAYGVELIAEAFLSFIRADNRDTEVDQKHLGLTCN